jgi:trk system potassium uptake protein TrkA
VIIAATGDDEDNLVVSWLAKQEFGVPRVIARINNSKNEWLFGETWGVDVAVSTPALITSLVDEAVEVGSIINLMDLAHGRMHLVEITLASDSPAVAHGRTLDELRLPDNVRVVTVVRNDQPMVPAEAMHFLEHDHVILITRGDAKESCATAFIG